MDFTEDVDKALKICRVEKMMRESVFKSDYTKRKMKELEMDFVMGLLRNYKKTLTGMTGNLFSEGD